MKNQNLFKSMLFLLLGLVCSVAWAQTGNDGPIVTFTNVQQDGTTYTLYINDAGELATSTDTPETLGEASKFRATLQANGKYTFYNEAKQLYMIWRNNDSGGYNSNKGVMDVYNATYCDWSLTPHPENGTFFITSKRDGATKDGSLIVLDSNGLFDTFDGNLAWSGTYSNLFRIETSEALDFTLTDSNGQEYSGTCTSLEPIMVGVSLSNKTLQGNKFTADITFPFPVSSESGATNWSFIETAPVNSFNTYIYVRTSDGQIITKSTRSENGMTYLPKGDLEEIKKWMWAIYPEFNEGRFTFRLKNAATGKYVPREPLPSSSAAVKNSIYVTTKESSASFCWGTCVNNGFGFYLHDNTNVFFGANSTTKGEQGAMLWYKSGTHAGCNLTIVPPKYYVNVALTLSDDVALTGTQIFDYVPNNTGDLVAPAITLDGLPAGLISNESYSSADNTYNATVDLPFPVSKPEQENWTFIKTQQMTSGQCYFYTNGNNVVTKSTNAENGYTYLPSANINEIKKWQWAIYPSLNSGQIVFTIKNRAANKFLGSSNVTLTDNGAYFLWTTCIGTGYGFSSLDNNKFFSANSSDSGERAATLWGKAGSSHKGANLEFPATSYTTTIGELGYTALYTPVAISTNASVFSAKLNSDNTQLSLKRVVGTIPANSGVLLKGTAGAVCIQTEVPDADPIDSNAFTGTHNDVSVSDIEGIPYTLQANSEGAAVFKKHGSETIAGGQAYLLLPEGEEDREIAIPSSLVMPGRYYRIAYDFGNAGVKYLQSTSSPVRSLEMTDNKDESSIFFVEQVGENLRLKSYSTGKYLKEDGNTRGLHDEGGNVTFTETELGSIKIQAPSYLHAGNSNGNYYIDHCGNDASHEAHKFIMVEADYRELTVQAQSKIGATASWKGITKVLPATWGLFDEEPISNTVLTINSNASYTCTGMTENEDVIDANTLDIGVLSENRTLTANFTPAFFSDAYGDKWVRLQNCSNGSYWANVENGVLNAKGKTATLDNTYTDDKQLWCLVGDADNFTLYNKAAGGDLFLGVSSCNQETEATLVDNAGSVWKLKEQEFGYAIMPASTENTGEHGINMWAGNGGDLKLFTTNEDNKGSYWKIEAANPLSISVEVEEGQPYANNTRVCEITKVIAGRSSTSIVSDNVAPTTCYLPAIATFTLKQQSYRGYTFNGFVDANANAVEEYVGAYLPEGGLNITASYSVDETNKYQYLFYYRDDVHNKPYRIPAIATASNNTVLAFSDYRPCSNDIGYGEVDIMLRRSYDNGKTWSEAVCIADGQGGNDNVFNVGFGDAAVVADRESGKVLVMAVAGKQVFAYGSATGHNSMAKIVSNDNGESWNAPEDVTSQFMIDENSLFPKAYTMFFGSGRILQSRVYKAEGADYYRIYGALLIKHPSDTYTGECNYVVYSDDFGATWKILGGSIEAGMCCNGGNEPKVEELPDGTIILSSRKSNGRYFNVFKYTNEETGEGEWLGAVQSNAQTGGISFGNNSCNGEIYKVKAVHKESGRICDVMLQSVPTGNGRSNVSVYFKEMSYAEAYIPTTFAQNWTKGLEVSAMGSAYSTMILQADANFGFFYEELPGDNYAYCMVYVPLSLEELTNGAYSLYTVNSTIGEHKVGTFYATEAMQIPYGIKAYVATETPETDGENGRIHMTRLEGIIPANTGAVLRAESADTYTFVPSISYGTPVDGNMLVGYEAADNDADSYKEFDDVPTGSYVLTVKNEKAAFYRWNASVNNPKFRVYNNKAYLQVPAAGNARAIYFSFDGEDATGIIETESENVKAQIYDLSGRRVQNVQKGIYIVNGNKVLK